jgi:hypothetical protein
MPGREVKEGLNGAQLCFRRGVFLIGCGCVLVPGFLFRADDDTQMGIIEKSEKDSQPFSRFAHLRIECAGREALVIFGTDLGPMVSLGRR